tara:strand:+ start:171 stop:644 length:474 start_codon:yes stop_codon:yes gene_type:complete
MSRAIFIYSLILLLGTQVYAGSFSRSTLFGSEADSSVTNPEIRSLSYSLQYMTFAGISSYFVKQLHDNGFFGPIGFKPDYLQSLSPLAYGNFPDKINKSLLDAKNDIHRRNEILIMREKLLKSPTNSTQLLRESESMFETFLSNEENRLELISRYIK